MPRFGKESLNALTSCDERLWRLMHVVIEYFDFKVLCGHRNQADQDAAFARGDSKLKWPDSKHNRTPSLAVDIAPWPIDFNNRERFLYLGGYVMLEAKRLGIPIRWGGDWANAMLTKNVKASWDPGHYEIKEDSMRNR